MDVPSANTPDAATLGAMKPDRSTADSRITHEYDWDGGATACVVCPLSLLECGDVGRVVRLVGPARATRRLFALGVRPGIPCRVLGRAPGGSPLHLRAGSVHLMLRGQEAADVLVETVRGGEGDGAKAEGAEVDGDVPEM